MKDAGNQGKGEGVERTPQGVHCDALKGDQRKTLHDCVHVKQALEAPYFTKESCDYPCAIKGRHICKYMCKFTYVYIHI